MWSYLSMGFRSTGITKRYAKLNGAKHELLCHDFRYLDEVLKDNPFADMCASTLDEVVVPTEIPPTNLVDDPFVEPLRMAVGA
jgi:hypothetical protein